MELEISQKLRIVLGDEDKCSLWKLRWVFYYRVPCGDPLLIFCFCNPWLVGDKDKGLISWTQVPFIFHARIVTGVVRFLQYDRSSFDLLAKQELNAHLESV